ncbi:DUF1788 domain-containing protein [Enterorhabdus sp. P55]|uniref:DUF1788 domain-containing protein n=1 Tax=Enterorhabdus sp. P55 TaxID=2304571 RepID=UPI00191BEDB4
MAVDSRDDLTARIAVLRDRLADPDFLANRGLGNEVGIFMLCYDPRLELEARELLARVVREAESGALPCRVVERNLYDVFLAICEERRILDKIPQQEAKRGTDALLAQLAKVATPEAFVRAMDYQPHQPGDVLLITGVGEVYPFMRVHNVLDNLQHVFHDMPLVVAYPGRFDGQSLRLFSGARAPGLPDGSYYRAFNLV